MLCSPALQRCGRLILWGHPHSQAHLWGTGHRTEAVLPLQWESTDWRDLPQEGSLDKYARPLQQLADFQCRCTACWAPSRLSKGMLFGYLQSSPDSRAKSSSTWITCLNVPAGDFKGGQATWVGRKICTWKSPPACACKAARQVAACAICSTVVCFPNTLVDVNVTVWPFVSAKEQECC